MEIYFPIAELPINIFVLLLIGFGVGLISGFFGIGGGFLMTPLLVLSGVPPAIAVGTQSCQLVASSISGLIYYRRNNCIDYKMGSVLLIGGSIGSIIGIKIFYHLQASGFIDLFISLTYIILFGALSILMMVESSMRIMGLHKVKPQKEPVCDLASRPWYIMYFSKSDISVHLLRPIMIGFAIGLIVAILGAGGGFLMVPAMAYIIGMKGRIVSGTSMFQVFFLSCFVTFMQATQNQTVDILLAMFLIVGGIIGVQFGVKFGNAISQNYNRLFLSVIVLLVCLALFVQLIYPPEILYTVRYF